MIYVENAGNADYNNNIVNKNTREKTSMSNPSDFIIENGVLTKYTGPGGDVVIPDGVTSIGDQAFHCGGLTSVTIPESVTSIGTLSFFMNGLTSVTIPEGVTSIGDRAFCCCNSLTSVTIPESVTSIGNSAFYECRRLTSVTIPDNVTNIGSEAFSHCICLADEDGFVIVGHILFDYEGSGRDVSIPEGVTSIGDVAFYGCNSLTSVTIPDSVTSIGNSAFYKCSSLASVMIPDSVTSIGNSAFWNCSSLTSVTIPGSVTSIGNEAFRGCISLTSLTIPNSVTSIGDEAFYNCSSLTNVTIPAGVINDYGKVFNKILSAVLWIQNDAEATILALYINTKSNNLNNFGKKGFWPKYDIDLITGIEYKFRLPVRLLGALGRLERPVELSDDSRQAYKELLSKNIKKVIPLLEEYHRPDLIRLLFDQGIIKDKDRKAVLKLIAASTDPEVAALAKEDLPCGTNQQARTEEPSEAEAELRKLTDPGEAGKKLKSYYLINAKSLPALYDQEEKRISESAFAWLLTAHETLEKDRWGRDEVLPEYNQAGICPNAAKFVERLDQNSMQTALMSLADSCLGFSGLSKKMYLAYPICRYADEATMAELTKRAPKWASSVSGINAPGLKCFREAALYSNTRSAMLFAERYGELDKYAKLRGMSEDELRDKYLSDVGLDERGGKVYDLGNQTVTARLQKDLSFLFELPGGKTAKSLPKKNADPAKYEAAKADFDEMRKAVRKIVKSRSDNLFRDFLSGKARKAEDWQDAYLKNALLRSVAELVVWEQNGKTFILSKDGPIDSDEKPYSIGKRPIKVAHPMETEPDEVTAWQKYFTRHGLRQPFLQIWEPVIDPTTIQEDRYEGSVQPMYRFSGKDKHGIHSGNLYAFSEDIGFSLDDCDLDYEASTWQTSYDGADGETYMLGKFSFEKYTRRVNHIVALLDGWTVEDRIKKDDTSVSDRFDTFTLAQITDFIHTAQEANAVNVLALLLDYKNSHFADFDPMDEFTLE